MPRFSLRDLTLILSALLVGCGGGGTTSSSSKTTTKTIRVMPLGDSITMGQYVEGGYRLPLQNELASKLPKLSFNFVGSLTVNSDGMVQPDHEGHSGWRLIDFLGEGGTYSYSGTGPIPITQYVLAAMPDVILLMLGTNDRYMTGAVDSGAIDIPEFERRYRALLDDIYALRPDVKIAWMEVTQYDVGDEPHVVQARAAAAAVAQEYQAKGKKIVVIDPRSRFDTSTMLTDFVHPNALGYATLGDMYESAIEALTK